MKQTKKENLYHKLQAFNIFPLLILGIVIALFSIHIFIYSMKIVVRDELSSVADTVILTYDTLYPGNYELVGDVALNLTKGDHVLNGDYKIIDTIKSQTNLELTLFYQDTRILTTIHDNATKERIIGSGARDLIITDVLDSGIPHFYDSAIINGEKYFAYYCPLTNPDGSVVGMVFVGKPLNTLTESITLACITILGIALIAALLAALLTSSYISKIIAVLREIEHFLSQVSTGNLSAQMHPNVLSRNDALSDIGYSALNMQRSLKILVEQDVLTELSNRRYGNTQLNDLQKKSYKQGLNFAVALGDIDFFKKVNDTYGHDCGDYVLKEIASILKHNMAGHGYAIRWGGEEFLLVFANSNYTYEDHCSLIESILNQIRNTEFVYEKQSFHVTMTFGIVPGTPDTNVKNILLEVDKKLYRGKTSGRNQIVP